MASSAAPSNTARRTTLARAGSSGRCEASQARVRSMGSSTTSPTREWGDGMSGV